MGTGPIYRYLDRYIHYTYTVCMIEFEWNRSKATINLRKHGVSFEEAQSVFFDEHALQFFDDSHSTSEDRFIMLGMSIKSRLLIVCHCESKSDHDNSIEVIRIISARRATKAEQKFYTG